MKKDYLSGNKISLLLFSSLLIVVLNRFFYIGNFAATWDQVDFALALDRFDLRMMQPHFPGYPIFVWGGMMVNKWVADPVQALIIFNKIMMGLSAIPMFLIARRYFTFQISILIVLFWQTFPYLNVLSSQPMSEAAAISMLWWFLWSILIAIEKNKYTYHMLPLFMFSLLLGIRLSYIAFGVAIIGLWVIYGKKKENDRLFIKLISLIFLAALFQLIWVGALVVSEGSLQGFLSLALSFTGGHFTEWGGAITGDKTPLINRLVLIVMNNVIWVGLAVKSNFLMIVLVLTILLTGYKKTQLKGEPLTFYYLFSLCAVSYFLWAIFAQNIDKPRHIAPLVLFVGFWLALKVNHMNNVKVKTSLILLLVILQLFLGNQLMEEQEFSLPATYQLTHFLENQKDPILVFAWEETRTMDYLDVNFSYRRVWTYELFLQTMNDYDQRTVYLTDHVLEGFRKQGINLEHSVVKKVEFFSNDLFDPTYHHIVLYEWVK